MVQINMITCDNSTFIDIIQNSEDGGLRDILDELSQCNCCERHQQGRQLTLEP
jgi:hypothetical protein